MHCIKACMELAVTCKLLTRSINAVAPSCRGWSAQLGLIHISQQCFLRIDYSPQTLLLVDSFTCATYVHCVQPASGSHHLPLRHALPALHLTAIQGPQQWCQRCTCCTGAMGCSRPVPLSRRLGLSYTSATEAATATAATAPGTFLFAARPKILHTPASSGGCTWSLMGCFTAAAAAAAVNCTTTGRPCTDGTTGGSAGLI
jgi:hypothetical protein